MVRAGSPNLPGRGHTGICRVAETIAREFVSDLVEFAVYVASGPGTTCLRELLTQVVAFSEEVSQVAPKATPAAGHLHDNYHRVEFKDQ